MSVYIAVVGSSEADGDEARLATEVGRGLGQAGAVLVCGGLGGVMEAACRGAKESDGITVGILPGTDRRDANSYVDIALPTGMGEMRNALVVRAVDAVIAVSGEYGTLSEVALALRIGTPVVGLRTWELAKEGRTVDAFPRCSSPAEAVALALDLASPRG